MSGAPTHSVVDIAVQSPDVLSLLMAALDPADVAAACVCTMWHAAFAQRMRGLLSFSCRFEPWKNPDDGLGFWGRDAFTRPRLEVDPGGDRLHVMCQRVHPGNAAELLFIEPGPGMHGVASSAVADMVVLPYDLLRWETVYDDEGHYQGQEPMSYWSGHALGHDSMYVAFGYGGVCHVGLDGSRWCLRSHMKREDLGVWKLAVSTAFLFAVVHTQAPENPAGRWEVVAFNLDTLQHRHAFAGGQVHCDSGMAVSGDDLYVCGLSSILVFSFHGELKREIAGPWRRPSVIRIYDGRLYLLEAQEYEQRRDSTEVKKAKKNTALRICVLTLDGELCQEYSVMDARNSFPRNWLRGRLNDMNFVADKLVLSCEWARSLLSLRLA